jgi:hypothetical protein
MWFNEKFSQLGDRRKKDKLRWLKDPSEAYEYNLRELRREASGHFRQKKREHIKYKINDQESNRKNMNIRDLYRA